MEEYFRKFSDDARLTAGELRDKTPDTRESAVDAGGRMPEDIAGDRVCSSRQSKARSAVYDKVTAPWCGWLAGPTLSEGGMAGGLRGGPDWRRATTSAAEESRTRSWSQSWEVSLSISRTVRVARQCLDPLLGGRCPGWSSASPGIAS